MTDKTTAFALMWFGTGFIGTLHLAGYLLGWWPVGAEAVTWWLTFFGFVSMTVLQTADHLDTDG